MIAKIARSEIFTLADESASQCLINNVKNGEIALSAYENERFVLKSYPILLKKLNLTTL